MFDVFDGRKIQSANLLEDLTEDEEFAATGGSGAGETNLVAGKPFEAQTMSGQQLQAASGSSRKQRNGSSVCANKEASSRKGRNNNGNQFSWSRLLSHKNRMQLKCCLAKSETSQEICLSPSAGSSLLLVGAIGLSAGRDESPFVGASVDLNEAISAAMCPELDDDQEDAELKAEVLQIMSPLVNKMRRCSSSLSEVSSRLDNADGLVGSPEQQHQQQQHIMLDAAFESGNISVCLFDKRTRFIMLKMDAENGRRWARMESRLRELCFKLTGSIIADSLSITSKAPDGLEEKVNKFVRRRMETLMKEGCTVRERISKTELEQLIDLTKNSLNHLIDAQLLLR